MGNKTLHKPCKSPTAFTAVSPAHIAMHPMLVHPKMPDIFDVALEVKALTPTLICRGYYADVTYVSESTYMQVEEG